VTGFPTTDGWPELRLADWQDTRDTVHMWTQIVGKIRLAVEPMVNHWWQVPLYVTATGLTTSLMPHRRGGFEIAFDFRRHVLTVTTVRGEQRELLLRPRSVADLHAELFSVLADLGLGDIAIFGRPVEVDVAIPFAEDTVHASYDPIFAERFWRSLVSAHRVLTRFRAGFVGKVSPVHFWWGAFDLAVTRFNGKPAPRHPGGVPNCADWVMETAYSHEAISCGYWPGGADEGAFYSYAYPAPPGFAEAAISPPAAFFDTGFSEFLLPYAAVRSAPDPDAAVLTFLQSTYENAADLAGWDRASLERPGVGTPVG
jgi:hypothetical protein